MTGKTAAHRGAGAGGKGRVEAVDVESQVHRVVTDPGADLLGDLLRPTAVDLPCIQHLEAHHIVIGGAQADLHRARRIDQSLAGRVVEHGAVIDAFDLFVRPGVAVRVEVDQRQRAVFFRVCLEQRVADEVVATQGEHGAARGQNPVGMGLDGSRSVLRRAMVEMAVAVIDAGQQVERIKLPGIVTGPRRLDRGGTNGARAEAAAGTVGGRGVEGHAADHQIHPAQVAGVAATHEAGDAGVGRFGSGAIQAVTGDGLIVVEGLVHGHYSIRGTGRSVPERPDGFQYWVRNLLHSRVRSRCSRSGSNCSANSLARTASGG